VASAHGYISNNLNNSVRFVRGAGETSVRFCTFVMVWQYEKLLYCPRNNAKSILSEEWQPKD